MTHSHSKSLSRSPPHAHTRKYARALALRCFPGSRHCLHSGYKTAAAATWPSSSGLLDSTTAEPPRSDSSTKEPAGPWRARKEREKLAVAAARGRCGRAALGTRPHTHTRASARIEEIDERAELWGNLVGGTLSQWSHNNSGTIVSQPHSSSSRSVLSLSLSH